MIKTTTRVKPYVLGKDDVLKGLEDGVFYRKEDGSVWIDLEDEGLDHKLVLRRDGTCIYMTRYWYGHSAFKDFDAKDDLCSGK